MTKYTLDPRVLPGLVISIEQDIEADFFTGQFKTQAISLVKKLRQTNRPDLDREEYEWLRIYISGLLCEDLDYIEDETQIAERHMESGSESLNPYPGDTRKSTSRRLQERFSGDEYGSKTTEELSEDLPRHF